MALRRIHGQLRNLNWKPSRPNQNAKVWKPAKFKLESFPAKLDAIDAQIPIWDQGQLGSCTGHGTTRIFAFAILLLHGLVYMPSRLFAYFVGRMIEGDIADDTGCQVADVVDGLITYGCPPESEWPYDIDRFAEQPPAQCWTDGLKERGVEKNSVAMDVATIKASLMAKLPVVFGFTVFSSFESQIVAETGEMPVPQDSEQVLGGHCVVFVGWDDAKKALLVSNSWGAGWGVAGRFWMPYENLVNCSDGWNLPKVS